MKQLEPIILKEAYWQSIEDSINDYFWDIIYKPIQNILKGTAVEIKNASDPLSVALAKGSVYYDNGKFKGDFNSAISRQLKGLGANFKKGAWNLSESKFTPQISMAIALAEDKFKKINNQIISQLDSVDFKSEQLNVALNGAYDESIEKMNKAFEKTVSQIAIAPKLTPEMKNIIKTQWAENLELYIQDWTAENILKLREEVRKNAFSGQRAQNLVKLIQKNFGSSKSKAKFLARQETSLLVSKFREERYKSVGVRKYRWSSSNDSRVRDRHRELNGKIFEFSNPPASGVNGERQNAGEPFGCRCVAVPIIDED